MLARKSKRGRSTACVRQVEFLVHLTLPLDERSDVNAHLDSPPDCPTCEYHVLPDRKINCRPNVGTNDLFEDNVRRLKLFIT